MNQPKQRFTDLEELANALSHGTGAVLAAAVLVLLVISAVLNGTVWHTVSFAVFGATLLVLYISSTMNHSLPNGSSAKDFFHNFDQIAIFLLIAGTYTPISIANPELRASGGWIMFGIEWILALLGIILKVFMPNKFEKGVATATIIMYALMGWLVAFFAKTFVENSPPKVALFIFAGGAVYTLGIIFYKLEGRIRYSHLGWHIMVLAGSGLHAAAVWKTLI